MAEYVHTINLHAPLAGVGLAQGKVKKNGGGQGAQAQGAPGLTEAELKEKLKKREEKGYQRGYTTAKQELQAETDAAKEAAQQLQQRVLQRLDDQFEAFTQQLNGRVPSVVKALVKRVLGGAAMDGERISALVKEALGCISSPEEAVEVALSPADAALLKGEGEAALKPYRNITIIEDANLTSGDCLLRSRFGLVDARLETKLAKLFEDLKV